MTHTERVKPPLKRHRVEPVIDITNRAFQRNLHSMVHTYLKVSGEKRIGKMKEFFPPSYKSSRKKLKRTA